MPTYTYRCKKCGEERDVFHPMSATPRVKCVQCGSACQRLMGKGSGIIFKGSGFYETDYKNKGGKPSEGSSSKSSSESKTETKSEPKTESKSESKPESKTEKSSDSSTAKKAAAS